MIDELADTKMIAQAIADRFVVIVLMPPSIANRPNGSWLHPQTDCGGAGGVVGGGSCSSPNPSDEGYIKAAVADATSRFALDASRRWILGGSAGANMARDALCDSSALFRGGMTMGGGANAKYGTTTGACPAGNKHVFYLEISGKNTQQDPYRTINLPSNCTTALRRHDPRTRRHANLVVELPRRLRRRRSHHDRLGCAQRHLRLLMCERPDLESVPGSRRHRRRAHLVLPRHRARPALQRRVERLRRLVDRRVHVRMVHVEAVVAVTRLDR